MKIHVILEHLIRSIVSCFRFALLFSKNPQGKTVHPSKPLPLDPVLQGGWPFELLESMVCLSPHGLQKAFCKLKRDESDSTVALPMATGCFWMAAR